MALAGTEEAEILARLSERVEKAVGTIQELRRVAGKQLDARFVEIFIELLEGEDVSFRHGEEADFEKELALEARIAETASPAVDVGRFQVPA